MRGWLFLIIDDPAGYAGHDGYDDVTHRHYSWDSKVANWSKPAVGDLIILRNTAGSLGIGWLESRDEEPADKLMRRCPECQTTQLDIRKTMTPKYRCRKHGHVFEDPVTTTMQVTAVKGRYERSFTALQSLGPGDLEPLCLARSRRNAIRELDVDRAIDLLRRHSVDPQFFLSAG